MTPRRDDLVTLKDYVDALRAADQRAIELVAKAHAAQVQMFLSLAIAVVSLAGAVVIAWHH